MSNTPARGPDPTDKTEEIKQSLRDYDRPFMGTGELADALGYESNPGVAKHLKRAVEANEIEKTTISGYNIWYLPNLVQRSEIAHEVASGPAPGSGGGSNSKTFDTHTAPWESLKGMFLGEGMKLPGAMVLLAVAAFVGFTTVKTAKTLMTPITGGQPIIESGRIDVWGLSALTGAAGLYLLLAAGVVALVFNTTAAVILTTNSVTVLITAAAVPVVSRIISTISMLVSFKTVGTLASATGRLGQ